MATIETTPWRACRVNGSDRWSVARFVGDVIEYDGSWPESAHVLAQAEAERRNAPPKWRWIAMGNHNVLLLDGGKLEAFQAAAAKLNAPERKQELWRAVPSFAGSEWYYVRCRDQLFKSSSGAPLQQRVRDAEFLANQLNSAMGLDAGGGV